MKAPLGALYTVSRWGTGATVATFVDSSDVVVTATSDGCPILTASLATVEALLPTRAGSASEAAVATVATRPGQVPRRTQPPRPPRPRPRRPTSTSQNATGHHCGLLGAGRRRAVG